MRTETNGHDNVDALRINARHIADTGMPLGKRTPEHLTGAADELEARRAECETLSALVAEYENALELGTFAARYHIAWCEAAQKIADETTAIYEAKYRNAATVCEQRGADNERLRDALKLLTEPVDEYPDLLGTETQVRLSMFVSSEYGWECAGEYEPGTFRKANQALWGDAS